MKVFTIVSVFALTASALEIPLKNQELLALTFARAEERAVRDTLRIAGRFELMPNAETVYATPISGRVAMRVRPPQKVNAGDVLFTLESPEGLRELGELALLEADAKAAATRATLLQNRVEALRNAGRRDAGLEMELADAKAEAARAEVELEWKKKIVGRIGLRPVETGDRPEAYPTLAKSGGTVLRLATTNGAWLETGGEVLTIAENKIWFRADANTREAATLRDGQKAFVEPPRGMSAGLATRIETTLEMGFPDSQTPRVTPLFAEIKTPPEWARPGRAGVLCVVTRESAPRAVAVPDASLAQDGVKTYVIARDVNDATRFHKREVIPGASDGVWTEVGGLRVGEEVVVDGVYQLNLAMPLSEGAKKMPAGHFHADGTFHEGSH